MVPPGSWSPAGTAAKPKTVPPVSSDRRQPGATRQSGGANWCHPPVRHAGSSPADSAWKPETVPPRFSPKQCHPSVRRHHADLRCHPAFRVPRWCHPSVCRTFGATPQSQNGATRQFGVPVRIRTGPLAGSSPAGTAREPRTSSPKQCHPPVRRGQLVPPAGSSRQFVSGRFGLEARNSASPLFVFQDGATRQFARVSLPNVRCHPPIWGAEVASLLLASQPRIAPVRPL